MSTLVRIIIASIIAILSTSCNFNFISGIEGNGIITTKNRQISEDFNSIIVSRGIKVIITQSDSVSLKVTADENLHNIITTEVDSAKNILRISSDENIKNSATKTVYLSVKDLNIIRATSGAIIKTDGMLKTKNLRVDATSGSQLDLDVDTKKINCNTTSGTGIKIYGKTDILTIAATSGSYIKASGLNAKSTQVGATSGANITVNATNTFTANANSGASIKYSGNPSNVTKNSGFSGSIRQI